MIRHRDKNSGIAIADKRGSKMKLCKTKFSRLTGALIVPMATLMFAAMPRVVRAEGEAIATPYENLFTRTNKPFNWVIGDGSFAVRLPNGHDLFMFGDSGVGIMDSDGNITGTPTWNPAPFINNTFVDCIGTRRFTGLYNSVPWFGKLSPTSKIVPADSNHFYWPSDAIQLNGIVYIFVNYFANNNGFLTWLKGEIKGYDYTQLANTSYTPTTLGPMPTTDYPGSNGTIGHVQYGSALMTSSDGFTYIYGSYVDPDWGFNKKSFLARVRTGRLISFDSWRYWTGTAWSTSASAARPIASFMTSCVVQQGAKYIMFAILDNATKINGYVASKPQGTADGANWDSVPVTWTYTIPELPDTNTYIAYLPHVYPAITNGTNTLMSYNINHQFGVNPIPPNVYYRPHFIWADLAAIAATGRSGL
jgi:hypothetical protein